MLEENCVERYRIVYRVRSPSRPCLAFGPIQKDEDRLKRKHGCQKWRRFKTQKFGDFVLKEKSVEGDENLSRV